MYRLSFSKTKELFIRRGIPTNSRRLSVYFKYLDRNLQCVSKGVTQQWKRPVGINYTLPNCIPVLMVLHPSPPVPPKSPSNPLVDGDRKQQWLKGPNRDLQDVGSFRELGPVWSYRSVWRTISRRRSILYSRYCRSWGNNIWDYDLVTVV